MDARNLWVEGSEKHVANMHLSQPWLMVSKLKETCFDSKQRYVLNFHLTGKKSDVSLKEGEGAK